MWLSAVWVVLLLAANAFFVAAEFALVKARGLRIEPLAAGGSGAARLTMKALHEIEAYLAACQLGITMASLGLGWVGEPAVAALLEPLFRAAGLSEKVLHTAAFITGFLIFSSLHIVVGEQVPKTFAIRKPEPVALWVMYPLEIFYRLIFPLNWLLNKASGSLLRAMGVAEASHVEVFSGEELRGAIGASFDFGAMRKQDHDMLGGVLDLQDVEVQQIMTHRRQMLTINADTPPAEAVSFVHAQPYTRYPVWQGDPDSIVGVLHAKDLLVAFGSAGAAPNTGLQLTSLLQPPWFIPSTTTLRHQLFAFRERRSHLALVVDEYGAILGLVTLEDILEEIVGEIVDEKDVEVEGVQLQPDGSVIAEGQVAVRDLNREFEWDLPDEEATTIAGLVINAARRIPEVGQRFTFYGFRFEILRRQRHQISLLRIIPPEDETPAGK